MHHFLLFSSWSLWGLFTVILWIWALVDIVKGNFGSSNTKLIWILVVILIPLIGSILYLLIGRNQKI